MLYLISKVGKSCAPRLGVTPVIVALHLIVSPWVTFVGKHSPWYDLPTNEIITTNESEEKCKLAPISFVITSMTFDPILVFAITASIQGNSGEM
jgi:hypothetical protein